MLEDTPPTTSEHDVDASESPAAIVGAKSPSASSSKGVGKAATTDATPESSVVTLARLRASVVTKTSASALSVPRYCSFYASP